MRAYSASTVIRLTSNQVLASFFEHENCMTAVDFKRDKLYEIQDAFRLMSESDRQKVEDTMRKVFTFANNEDAMMNLTSEIRSSTTETEQAIINDLSHVKSRYDKAFMVYLNYPSIWKKACIFIHADSLSHRFWTRYPNLPRKSPRTDRVALDELGQTISNYMWEKQIRGNRFSVTYERRTRKEHYFFVSLSDFSNTFEKWEGDEKDLVARLESRPLSMVLIYDEENGVLEINAHGGKEVYDAVGGFFSNVILTSEMDMKLSIKSSYQLDHLLFRENMLTPMSDCGVVNAKIVGMDLSVTRPHKRGCLKVGIDQIAPAETLYDQVEAIMADKSIIDIHVRHARIILYVQNSEGIQELHVEISARTCTLRSVSDDLRRIGSTYIERAGIDDQLHFELI